MSSRLRPLARWLLGLAFLAAGILHFAATDSYLPLMPPWLPWHRELILASGAAEILGGLGALWPRERVRAAAGGGLMLLLVAVFPANLHLALHDVALGGRHFSPAVRWGRLPFQAVFIAWAWWATRPTKSAGAPRDAGTKEGCPAPSP